MVCLQETKLEKCSENLVKSIWGIKNVGLCTVDAKGSAGGLIIMWRKDAMSCEEIMEGKRSLSCHFKNIKGEITWTMTGVYCRGSREEKEFLWEELHQYMKSFVKGEFYEEILLFVLLFLSGTKRCFL